MKFSMSGEVQPRDKTECDLLDFLVPTEAPLNVLVIEGSLCLFELRKLLPNCSLFVVTTDEDDKEDYKTIGASFYDLDYRETPLQFEEKFFDYIIAPRFLELCGNPQDIASGIGCFLKDTGFLLTSFLNVRHWKILREMMEGRFFYFCRHMFTKDDMERLLLASFYKDASFVSIEKKAPPEFLTNLIEAGFENERDDLEAEIWLVKAARSTPELAALKSLYTPEIRKRLSRLLHRIEYDVEKEKSCAVLYEFIQTENIFSAYLGEFAAFTVIHRERLKKAVCEMYEANGQEDAAAEFSERLDEADFD